MAMLAIIDRFFSQNLFKALRETSLQFFDLKTWWQGLLQLLGLLLVFDDEGVEESGASDLEFGAL